MYRIFVENNDEAQILVSMLNETAVLSEETKSKIFKKLIMCVNLNTIEEADSASYFIYTEVPKLITDLERVTIFSDKFLSNLHYLLIMSYQNTKENLKKIKK